MSVLYIINQMCALKCLLLNIECPNVNAGVLGCGCVDVNPPCRRSIEGDTQIFNNIYKRDVRPFSWRSS
jgi:hypothetical protein